MTALQKLNTRIQKSNSLLCVGLDSDVVKLPDRFQELEHPQFEFNKWIIDQTHEYVCAYKPNTAFYEARGWQGWKELELTMEYLRNNHSDIFTICDAKRADIGSTNEGYVIAIFDRMGFDAVTVNPYLGKEAIQPFLERTDKVIIILCRTSNPGSGELQDLGIRVQASEFRPLWQEIAHKVVKEWNTHDNCMLVVGATYPKELRKIREIVGEMTLLVPGIGVQGGEIEAVIQAGVNSEKKGMMINSSRGIIFANDPRHASKLLRDEINMYR